MKPKIYTDTSVIGGYYDDEFRVYSAKLIEEFHIGKKIIMLSDLTLKEIEMAPSFVREILGTMPEENKDYLSLDEESRLLAEKYISESAIGEKYIVDAQHIAIATVNRSDALVSWNFRHIVNLRRIHLYNATNLKYGYPIIEIRSPREVVDDE